MKTVNPGPVARGLNIDITFHLRDLRGYSVFTARKGSDSLGQYTTDESGRRAEQSARRHYIAQVLKSK